MGCYFEYFGLYPHSGNATQPQHYFDGGVTYLVTNNIQLDVRAGTGLNHAADDYIWEVPAGRLDPGETPEACARRELEEEAGVTAGTLDRLTTIYTTPGFTDERIHLFLATDLRTGSENREPDEFVEVHRLRWSRVLDLIRRGEIVDGKTLVSLMFVECFRRAR